MVDQAPLPRLSVTTRRIASDAEPLSWATPDAPLAWARRDAWLVGAGPVALRISADGSDRAASLATRWREIAAAATVDDDVRLPGTGLIAFGALAFDDRSAAESTLTVPTAVVGRRGDDMWLTTVSVDGGAVPPTAPSPFGPSWSASLGPGSLDAAGYEAAVRDGLDAIAAGTVGKLVLARDLVGTAPAGADLRRLVSELAHSYPDCWAYAVDGIIGASPETLLRVSGGTVTARVLAGTIARGPDDASDAIARDSLAASAKDRHEHAFAVESLLETLRPHTTALAPTPTFTLKLPNVWHLATDVSGSLSHEASGLDLVAAVAPTAAVAGTPTPAAMDAIARIEPFDRARYAGAVGWTDAAGDGDWAIALRCVQHSRDADGTVLLTAHAGAGIVAGSVPESEMLETRVKFRPIVEALA